jgi:AcrR family transcriptional regulator
MEVPSGDRFLLLNAVVRLALEEGRDGLTVRKILAASGVSRRSFNLNFSDLEDCLSVALEWKVERALFRARLAGGAAGTQMGGVIRALASLGDQIVSDRMFAELCFGEPAISGGAMRCRDRFLLDVSDLVRALGLDQLQAEATAGAIWGVASKQAGARNRVHRDLGVVVTLPYLALAPAMGGSAAIRAVCDEVSKTVQKKNNRQNRGWDHGQKIIDPGRNAA